MSPPAWFERNTVPRSFPRRRSNRVLMRCLVAVIGLSVVSPAIPTPASALSTSGWQWYTADLHAHSAVGSDGLIDYGVMSNAYKARGYNAVFATDHQGASSFAIGSDSAYSFRFDDVLSARWKSHTEGSPTASTNALVTSPVRTGSKSLHLKTSAGAFAETSQYRERGANLRSGTVTLDFSVYPTRIDANSGVYVSVALGGDPFIKSPDGYTTQGNGIAPSRSIVFVWQLGNARSVSSDLESRVVTTNLSYTLNQWNTYSINVTQAINNALAAADRPLDYNGLLYVKMSAAATNGTSDAYFDDLTLAAASPQTPGEEFVARNSVLDDYDTSSFRIFPAAEMGINRHAQRFNFGGITESQYNSFFGCTSSGTGCETNGTDRILATQQTGYPAQLNHPGEPGGVTAAEATSTGGMGADLIEARDQTMIDVWDDILVQGTVILNSWGSDMHSVSTLSVAGRGVATNIFAPSLTLDALMRSVYEGRTYVARNTFTGRVAFNLDPTSGEPYPARYPLTVPSSMTSTSVHLEVTSGLSAGDKIVWIRNGAVLATDSASGSSYNVTRSVSLANQDVTYVRAEVQDASGNRIAMTQPIFFRDAASLPAGISLGVDAVTTADGRSYDRLDTKGVTATSWASQSLTFTAENPLNALVEVSIESGPYSPTQVRSNGFSLPQSASAAAFEGATTGTWFFDTATHSLRVKIRQDTASVTAVVDFGGSADNQAPTAPGSVTATAVSGTRVDLTWSGSTDNVGVTGYTVLRDGVAVATLPTTARSYSDTSVTPSTQYDFAVDAFDGAGNHSTPGGPVTVATPIVTSYTLSPTADAYVDASKKTRNFGTTTNLRLDASPENRTYLRFDLGAITGAISKATLRVMANSSQSSGWVAHSVNGAWTEQALTFSNAPGLGPDAGASGVAVGGNWTSGDVTDLVSTGNEEIGLTTASSTALSLASRESGSATAPQLVIEVSGTPPPPDTEPPTVPTGVGATPVDSTHVTVSWTASTDNVAVAGYRIYRDSVQIAAVGASPTTYSDSGLTPSTTYQYSVAAVDITGNPSAPSGEVPATTPPTAGTVTTNLTVNADAYVDSLKPTTALGTLTTLRTDTSPEQLSYLQFDLGAINGAVTKVTLRIWANSASTAGYEVRSVADTGWSESGLTYQGAPAVGPSTTLQSGPFAAGAWTSVDVTQLISAGGSLRSLAIVGRSTTAVAYASREGGSAGAPQLVVETTD